MDPRAGFSNLSRTFFWAGEIYGLLQISCKISSLRGFPLGCIASGLPSRSTLRWTFPYRSRKYRPISASGKVRRPVPLCGLLLRLSGYIVTLKLIRRPGERLRKGSLWNILANSSVTIASFADQLMFVRKISWRFEIKYAFFQICFLHTMMVREGLCSSYSSDRFTIS